MVLYELLTNYEGICCVPEAAEKAIHRLQPTGILLVPGALSSPAQPSRKEKGRWWMQGGVNMTKRLRDGEEKLEIVM